MNIEKVAVIGSGVMGSGIAAQIANAGVPVVLLDIVPEGAEDRSALAKSAIEKMLRTDPAPFMHKKMPGLLRPAIWRTIWNCSPIVTGLSRSCWKT